MQKQTKSQVDKATKEQMKIMEIERQKQLKLTAIEYASRKTSFIGATDSDLIKSAEAIYKWLIK